MKVILFTLVASLVILLTACTTTDNNSGDCGTCPMYVSPAPGWCDDGIIIDPSVDECGCLGHPTCDRNLVANASNSDLQKNICTLDSDCWSTNGGCFTREWFAIEDAKAREQGIENQRPTPTPNILCTCEQNKCVQHVK